MPKEAFLIIDMLNNFVLKDAPLAVSEARRKNGRKGFFSASYKRG